MTNERQDPNEVSKMFFMTCELYIQHCYNIISTKGKTSDAVKPAYSNFRVMGLLYCTLFKRIFIMKFRYEYIVQL